MYTVCIYIYICTYNYIYSSWYNTTNQLDMIRNWVCLDLIYSHPIYDNIDREIYDQPADFGDT